MKIDAKPVKKSIVSDLEFDIRTSKRVAWSQWEFTVVAPFEIEVCNASYGFEKNEHTYRVMVDVQGIPVSCNCKGFTHYHSPNGRVGKHMLAVATIGGPTLLNAAVAFSPDYTKCGQCHDASYSDGEPVGSFTRDTSCSLPEGFGTTPPSRCPAEATAPDAVGRGCLRITACLTRQYGHRL
jgi:hypothetical protein